MYSSGLAALAELGDKRPLGVREHMLVIAILGAIADGKPELAAQVEREHGKGVPAGASYGFVRAYLLAWEEEQIKQGGG